MTASRIRRAAAAVLASAVLSACAGGGAAPALPGAASGVRQPQTVVGKYIRHVVIVVQENRSFDNFFHGFKGAAYANYGYTSGGARVKLQPGILRGVDIWHDWAQAMTAWNHGKMNGFDKLPVTSGGVAGSYAYRYVPESLIEPYWTMAKSYVLADHMFPTMFGPSFTGHLDLIAGTTDLDASDAEVDGPNAMPWGCDAPAGTTTRLLNAQRVTRAGPFPCFTQFRTLADTLDAAHVDWKYYAPPVVAGSTGELWSSFSAIRGVRYGPDWKRNVVSPETTVLKDAAKGRLPAVSWVIPDAVNSDHVSGGDQRGPSWVASVVNAVGKGPDWKTSAVIVVWDDWGGWYDSMSPPQLDFRGLGLRVPCIIVSPYAKAHYVSHTQYEFGSILRFVEEAFGLPPLGTLAQGYTDTRARSLTDSFDFTQVPRAFEPIPAPLGAEFFLRQPPSRRLPDEQ